MTLPHKLNHTPLCTHTINLVSPENRALLDHRQNLDCKAMPKKNFGFPGGWSDDEKNEAETREIERNLGLYRETKHLKMQILNFKLETELNLLRSTLISIHHNSDRGSLSGKEEVLIEGLDKLALRADGVGRALEIERHPAGH